MTPDWLHNHCKEMIRILQARVKELASGYIVHGLPFHLETT